MAAKLTFEAKMQGMEQVLDLLKRAEERMNDFGRVGSYAIEGVDRRLKEFESSLETINKSQNGLGGLFTKFDEANRKSGEFLGKSYRGIIDGMKQEVKAFETEADRVVNKIKESESALESFKSRRNAMSEADYQKGEASHTRELESLKGQHAAVISSKSQLERELFFKQPVNQGVHDFASKFGLGQWATVGGAMQLGGMMMGAPMIAGQAMNAVGSFGVQQFYTRQADAFLADARMSRSAAAQAMQGNITTSMVHRFGGGIEDAGMDSWSMRAKNMGQYLMENPFVRAGAGIGSIAMGGPIGWGVGAGLLYSSLNAPNRSYQEISAQNRSALRGRDKEMYENLYDPAGQGLKREGNELEGYQRTYGISGAHNLEMQYAYRGVSADRANPFLNQMQSLGMRPTNFGFPDQVNAVKEMYRASMSDPVRMAVLRGVALNGGTLSGGIQNAMGAFAGAGLTSAGDIAARGSMGEYMASVASTRGAGANDMGNVGAPIAAAISANAPGFNKVEGVGQGIANTQAFDRLSQGGSSAMSTIMIQKFREIGVTNPVTIDQFIGMDVKLPSTQAAIAKYTGKTVAEVRKALIGDVGQAYAGFAQSVLGKAEMDRVNAATGGDTLTYRTSGLKAFDNTTKGGATFSQSVDRMATGVEMDPSKVTTGAQSLNDKQDNATAAISATIDATMREILAGTGKEVTREITKSILDGFLQTAKEVQKTGDKFLQQREDNGAAPPAAKAPFEGTKKQSMSKGQQG